MASGKRIFISREQNANSVFYQTLATSGFDVHGESLIEFTAVPFTGIPASDWIFFYSKNGVRFFFEQLSTPLSSSIRLATIGPATADFLEENFGHPHFVGDGNAKTTSQQFLKKASGQKILFPRATKSRRSVQKWLIGKAELIDLIVYDNVPKKEIDLPDFECLVFTSPLNAQAYFSKKTYREGQTVVAIGSTTATALLELGIGKILQAESPSEESLAEMVRRHASIE
ncbi:MAG: uroporphyrinogen-III synthase [Bacteroidota bacterium]